jgi:hypothetical protein
VRTLPTTMIRLLAPFEPLFSKRVWQHAQVLLAGAILAPGRRTVSSALRAMGLDQHKRFHRYYRVLSRASWSSRKASRILLGLLVGAFVPEGPLVLGIDETLEETWGQEDQGERRLPRSGTLQPPSLREGQSSEVDLCDVARPGALGLSGLGLTVPFCSGLLRALRQGAGPAPQATHRVGLAATVSGETVVSGA